MSVSAQGRHARTSNQSDQEQVKSILGYHNRTKHHPERFARGPGGLDWRNQPDPFRRFAGAPMIRLPLAQRDDTPTVAALFGASMVPPRPCTLENIGLLFELSLGLSARKEISGSSWFLRMNPSSGNLHPTEAYLLMPVPEGLPGGAGVYHYVPLVHALEQRARWMDSGEPEAAGFWIGLTSIVWREAWKYGERAFRYCQHDVGHALGALRFAAAALGWSVQLLPDWSDSQLAGWLGLDRAQDFDGAEQEIPELLVWVDVKGGAKPVLKKASPAQFSGLTPEIGAAKWFGHANRLSLSHVKWPIIDQAIAASARIGKTPRGRAGADALPWPAVSPPQCDMTAARIIGQRRSALDFDGVTFITRETLLAILDTTLPRPLEPPFDAWPFAPCLHLVLFVHRVTGLEPGLYLWLRAPKDWDALQRAFRADLDWDEVAQIGPRRPLYRLGRGDLQDFGWRVACEQAIAAEGTFSLSMISRFEPEIRQQGADVYRQLHWEARLVGQALYLAAEMAGLRGTGIGCFFDDVMHRALGLSGSEWQDLYHFAIGKPIEDPRLRTLAPYTHLKQSRGRW